MKIVVSLAAVLALAVGLNLTAVDRADAWCGVGFRCRGAVLVPTPYPIPLRRHVVVAPIPCGGCGGAVVVAPAPCGGCGRAVVAPSPCGAPCPTAYYYMPPAYYAYWAQPAYVSSCNLGPGNCYWRRNCWYDSFGRRFCN
jgi:hypothetical protein